MIVEPEPENEIKINTTRGVIKLIPPKTARDAIINIVLELGYSMGGIYSICTENGYEISDDEELDIYTDYIFIDWGYAV